VHYRRLAPEMIGKPFTFTALGDKVPRMLDKAPS
jgi:hypothetical protein